MTHAHVAAVKNIRSVVGKMIKGCDIMILLEQSLVDLNKIEESLNELSVSL